MSVLLFACLGNLLRKQDSTHLAEEIGDSCWRPARSVTRRQAQSRRRGRRRTVNDVENRVLRAELLVQVGELSAARQALEGAAVAPGNQATLDLLTDATRRPPHLRTPLSPEVLGHTPIREFELDEPTFN